MSFKPLISGGWVIRYKYTLIDTYEIKWYKKTLLDKDVKKLYINDKYTFPY